MEALLKLLFLFLNSATSHGAELKDFEAFIEDIIETWQLRSPTILVKDDLLNICISQKHPWLLCLTNNDNIHDLENHLTSIYQARKQDGLIFVESKGQEKLLKHMSNGVPNIFISNNPVFMPISYQKDMQLRLDSNIFFYKGNHDGSYELYDIFVVKAGPPIKLEVGKWKLHNGLRLIKSLSRWDRRTDLQNTTLLNCLRNNPPWAQPTKDKKGVMIGSTGYYQEFLHYITEKLNLTTQIVMASGKIKILENGSWTGEIGFLQRLEVDVVSRGLGINLHRSNFIDYPLAVRRVPLTLIAKIPKGTSPNMWVYLEVFKANQWLIFGALLAVMVMGLSFIPAMIGDQYGKEFGTKRGSIKQYKLSSASSALSLVCLFTIQMGSHMNSKMMALRVLTFSLSILTLLLFAFYTTDITAKMTSGPSDIPIRNFEDVVSHKYKVVTHSTYYEGILSRSKLGSGKREVHNNQFEGIMGHDEAIKEVVRDSDSKTLYYATPSQLMPLNPSDKLLKDQLFALKMDDSVYSTAGLALQLDSEFRQIFNHYILKAYETGEFMRVYRHYHIDLFTKENFEMPEPQPLGFNNVMFCFMLLGFGICISLIMVMMEVIKEKILKEQRVMK